LGLIHKLNNVITVFTGHSGLLLLEPDLKPDVLQPVQQMSRAADLLSQCLNEAASMSRLSVLAPELIAVSELLEPGQFPSDLAVVKKYDEAIKIHADPQPAPQLRKQEIQIALNI